MNLLKERELLRDHVPELHDEAKCAKFYAAMLKGAKEYGFSQHEIDGIADHRVMLVFRDALIHLKLWSEP